METGLSGSVELKITGSGNPDYPAVPEPWMGERHLPLHITLGAASKMMDKPKLGRINIFVQFGKVTDERFQSENFMRRIHEPDILGIDVLQPIQII
jgi:hypothetical protein